MGAWSDEDVELLDEANNGGAGQGDWTDTIFADPGETVHFDILRTDGAGNANEWRIWVQASTDPSARWSSPAIFDRRFRSIFLNPNIAVEGFYAYRVYVKNDASAPVDVVKATVRWRKDNVNI